MTMPKQCLIADCRAAPASGKYYCSGHDGMLRFQSSDDLVREAMYQDWFQYLIAKLCDQTRQGASIAITTEV